MKDEGRDGFFLELIRGPVASNGDYLCLSGPPASCSLGRSGPSGSGGPRQAKISIYRSPNPSSRIPHPSSLNLETLPEDPGGRRPLPWMAGGAVLTNGRGRSVRVRLSEPAALRARGGLLEAVGRPCPPAHPGAQSYLTQCIYLLVLESYPPHKIVSLLFTITN